MPMLGRTTLLSERSRISQATPNSNIMSTAWLLPPPKGGRPTLGVPRGRDPDGETRPRGRLATGRARGS
eukprot:6725439-Alexandrium_andersonii.AAC.1